MDSLDITLLVIVVPFLVASFILLFHLIRKYRSKEEPNVEYEIEHKIKTRLVKRKFNIGKTEVRVTFEDRSVFSIDVYGFLDIRRDSYDSSYVVSSLENARSFIQGTVFYIQPLSNSTIPELVTEVKQGKVVHAKIWGTEDYEIEVMVSEVV